MGKRGPGRRIRAAGVIGAEAGAVLAWDYEMGLCDVDSDIGSILFKADCQALMGARQRFKI